jgi:hypothetical protein
MKPGHDEELMDILRDIPPLMPQFLRKRRVGLKAVDEILAEFGVTRPMLFTLITVHEVGARYARANGGVTLAELRASDPYATIDRFSEPIAQLMDGGYLQEEDGGVVVLSREARSAVDKLHTGATSYLASISPLPDEDMERLAAALERASGAVKSNPGIGMEQGSVLRGRLYFVRYGANRAPMVRIEQAIFELWGARDDAHVKAWREAEMEGPPFDLLAQVYTGIKSERELAEAVKQRQKPDDVEANLEWLTARDLLTRHGDELTLTPEGVLMREDVERETDRVYFEGWPFTPDEALWIRDTLEQLVGCL